MCSTGIFEIIMLLCFSAAWPFSIARSWRSKSTKGKSLIFLLVVLVGYISGIIHKSLCARDPVIGLYIYNCTLVLADFMIYLRNLRLEKKMAA